MKTTNRYPADSVMLDLAAIDNAEGGKLTPGGNVWVIVEGRLWQISTGSIDELERLGWIELLDHDPNEPDAARIKVTEKGRYWIKRWANANHKRLARM